MEFVLGTGAAIVFYLVTLGKGTGSNEDVSLRQQRITGLNTEKLLSERTNVGKSSNNNNNNNNNSISTTLGKGHGKGNGKGGPGGALPPGGVPAPLPGGVPAPLPGGVPALPPGGVPPGGHHGAHLLHGFSGDGIYGEWFPTTLPFNSPHYVTSDRTRLSPEKLRLKIIKDNTNILEELELINSIKRYGEKGKEDNKGNANRKVIYLSLDEKVINDTLTQIDFSILEVIIKKLLNHLYNDDFIVIKAYNIELINILELFRIIFELYKKLKHSGITIEQFAHMPNLEAYINTLNNTLLKNNNPVEPSKFLAKLEVIIKKRIKENLLIVSNNMTSTHMYNMRQTRKFNIYRGTWDKQLKDKVLKYFHYIEYIYANHDRLIKKFNEIKSNDTLQSHYNKGFIKLYYLNIRCKQIYRNFFRLTYEAIFNDLQLNNSIEFQKAYDNNIIELYGSLNYMYAPFDKNYKIMNNQGFTLLFEELHKTLTIDVLFIPHYQHGFVGIQLEEFSNITNNFYTFYMPFDVNKVNLIYISKDSISNESILELENMRVKYDIDIYKNLYNIRNKVTINLNRILIYSNLYKDKVSQKDLYSINIVKYKNIKTLRDTAIIHLYITEAGNDIINISERSINEFIVYLIDEYQKDYLLELFNKNRNELDIIFNITFENTDQNGVGTTQRLDYPSTDSDYVETNIEKFVSKMRQLIYKKEQLPYIIKMLGTNDAEKPKTSVFFSTFSVMNKFKIPQSIEPFVKKTKLLHTGKLDDEDKSLKMLVFEKQKEINEKNFYNTLTFEPLVGPSGFTFVNLFKKIFDMIINRDVTGTLPNKNMIYIKYSSINAYTNRPKIKHNNELEPKIIDNNNNNNNNNGLAKLAREFGLSYEKPPSTKQNSPVKTLSPRNNNNNGLIGWNRNSTKPQSHEPVIGHDPNNIELKNIRNIKKEQREKLFLPLGRNNNRSATSLNGWNSVAKLQKNNNNQPTMEMDEMN